MSSSISKLKRTVSRFKEANCNPQLSLDADENVESGEASEGLRRSFIGFGSARKISGKTSGFSKITQPLMMESAKKIR